MMTVASGAIHEVGAYPFLQTCRIGYIIAEFKVCIFVKFRVVEWPKDTLIGKKTKRTTSAFFRIKKAELLVY